MVVQKVLFLDLCCRGLGHLRRCLTLAEGLVRRKPDLSLMVATGSASVGHLRMPDGIDWVKVPTLRRANDGNYEGLTPGLDEAELNKIRVALTLELCTVYQPDVLFIDLLPRADDHEATTIVRGARRLLPNCKFVLVLRDIIDDPTTIVNKWTSYGAYSMLEEHYDRICLFGCPWIYDAVTEYRFPDALRLKSKYYGYISKWDGYGAPSAPREASPDAKIIVTVGGGIDGLHLTDTFLKSLHYLEADERSALIITGPEMGAVDFRRIVSGAEAYTDVQVTRFVKDLHHDFSSARLTISMAGYNSVSEIVEAGGRAILMPRGGSNKEQQIRARRFADLGYVDIADPETTKGETLAQQIREMLKKPQRKRTKVPFHGIEMLYEDLMSGFQEL